MRRSLSVALAAAVTAGAAVVLGAPAAPAATVPPVAPWLIGQAAGLADVRDMAAAGKYVYVSQGGNRNEVVAYDLAGRKVKTLAGMAGAGAMVVSADGSQLYVLLEGAEQVAVLDTVTNTEVRRISVAPCTADIAFAAGRLFYSTSCGSGDGALASLDPADATAPAVPALTDHHFYYAPEIEGGTNSLVVGESGLSPAWFGAYTAAADGTLTAGGSTFGDYSYSYLSDLDVSADGTRLLVTAGNPDGVLEFSLPGLTLTRTYGADNYAPAAALSPDGTRVAGGGHGPSYSDSFRLYDSATGNILWRRNATTGRDRYGWTHASNSVAGGELMTFSADGKQIFALVGDVYGENITLFRTVLAPVRTGVSVTVSAPLYDQPHTATATVTGATSGTVRFTYVDPEGIRRSLGSATMSNGKAIKTFRSTRNGRVEAIYSGDSSHLPAVTSKAFRPGSRTTFAFLGTYRKVDGVMTYRSYEKFEAKVTVGPAVSGRKVTISVWRRVAGTWRFQGSGKAALNRYGGVFLYYTERPKAGKYRISASFAGDSRNAPSSVTGPPFRVG